MLSAIALAAALSQDWIAEYEVGGDRVVLYADARGCPDGLKKLNYLLRPPYVQMIPGCYLIRDGKVFMWFLDGDKGSLKVEVFTWKRGHKPADL